MELSSEWLKAAALVLTGLFGAKGLQWFELWRAARKEYRTDQNEMIERRHSYADKEIERALKLKDETIQVLKDERSQINIENKALKDEVRLCQGEKEAFAKLSGEQAVKIAEMTAAKEHAAADLADAKLDIQRLITECASRDRTIERLQNVQTSARGLAQALNETEPAPPTTPPN